MTDSSGEIHEPRRVPPSHGWLWLKQGFSIVFANPVHWIGALLIWLVVNVVLNLLPVISTLSALIAPVLMGGLMLGAHEQDGGKGFNIERLVAGFSDSFRPLLVVGLVYMLGMIVIGLIASVTLGGLFSAATAYLGRDPALPPELAFNPLMWLPLLVALALSIPLLMAYWFAPALVILDKVTPMDALGKSMAACLKNAGPFLVYGLAGAVVLILGALPFFIGLLIVMPAIVASIYASYRDIFRD